MDTMVTMVIACCAFILLDIATGVVGAIKNRELSSSIMRDGLFNKVGEMFLLVAALVCWWLLTMPPFESMGIPPEIMSSVSIYIVCMELVSIVENICKINPEIPISKLFMLFNIDTGSHDDVESDQEHIG